jgi:ABC-2 type transporter
MRLLGLGHCADALVGDGGLLARGISGGERKRLTTAEMVVGPQRVLLMDEISTGLDSATLQSVITFFTSVRPPRLAVRLPSRRVCASRECFAPGAHKRCLHTCTPHSTARMRHQLQHFTHRHTTATCHLRTTLPTSQMSHALQLTTIVSLLQPPPEVFSLFDDLLLLAGGRLLYHGPIEGALPHFAGLGLVCPPRKDVPSFLLEITTPAGAQQQHWHRAGQRSAQWGARLGVSGCCRFCCCYSCCFCFCSYCSCCSITSISAMIPFPAPTVMYCPHGCPAHSSVVIRLHRRSTRVCIQVAVGCCRCRS